MKPIKNLQDYRKSNISGDANLNSLIFHAEANVFALKKTLKELEDLEMVVDAFGETSDSSIEYHRLMASIKKQIKEL